MTIIIDRRESTLADYSQPNNSENGMDYRIDENLMNWTCFEGQMSSS
jgi:hypothetical protein